GAGRTPGRAGVSPAPRGAAAVPMPDRVSMMRAGTMEWSVGPADDSTDGPVDGTAEGAGQLPTAPWAPAGDPIPTPATAGRSSSAAPLPSQRTNRSPDIVISRHRPEEPPDPSWPARTARETCSRRQDRASCL